MLSVKNGAFQFISWVKVYSIELEVFFIWYLKKKIFLMNIAYIRLKYSIKYKQFNTSLFDTGLAVIMEV